MADRKATRTIPAEEISTFCAEIAMMLGAGMQLYDGVEALAQTYAGTPTAALYQRVSEGVTATGSLHDALSPQDGWPAHVVEMTGIGERTGRLEEVMKGLSAYYSREKRIRDASVNAVTYPVVLALMLLVIVFVMIVTVMPVFQQMLSSMGVAMTATGLTMMHLGTVIGWVVLGIVGAAVLAVLVCTVLLRLGNRSAVMAGLMKLLPPLRRLNGKLAASRVFSVLSMMLSSGFPLDEALRMVPPVLEDEAIAARVKTISEDISEGVGFGDALEKADLLDPIHTRMIRMAHTIGREDEVMARIAATYEEQVEDGMSDLVSIIEPTLVALLCLVIGAILLSVMLPMAGIISSIL